MHTLEVNTYLAIKFHICIFRANYTDFFNYKYPTFLNISIRTINVILFHYKIVYYNLILYIYLNMFIF